MNNKLTNLKAQLHVAHKSFDAAVELADYESANILAQKLELLTKQIILCIKQELQEQN